VVIFNIIAEARNSQPPAREEKQFSKCYQSTERTQISYCAAPSRSMHGGSDCAQSALHLLRINEVKSHYSS